MSKSVSEMNIGELMVKINNTANDKGWWTGYEDLTEDQKLDKINTKLLLIVGEVSEAAEELRDLDKMAKLGFDLTDIYYKDEHGTISSGFYGRDTSVEDGVYMKKPEGFIVELVDVVVRVLDLAQQAGLPFVQGLTEKLQFNDARSFRHGGKKF